MVVSSCYRNPRSFRPLMDRLISRARVPLIEMIADLSPETITPSVIFIVHPTNCER